MHYQTCYDPYNHPHLYECKGLPDEMCYDEMRHPHFVPCDNMGNAYVGQSFPTRPGAMRLPSRSILQAPTVVAARPQPAIPVRSPITPYQSRIDPLLMTRHPSKMMTARLPARRPISSLITRRPTVPDTRSIVSVPLPQPIAPQPITIGPLPMPITPPSPPAPIPAGPLPIQEPIPIDEVEEIEVTDFVPDPQPVDEVEEIMDDTMINQGGDEGIDEEPYVPPPPPPGGPPPAMDVIPGGPVDTPAESEPVQGGGILPLIGIGIAAYFLMRG